jgi:hypothetical protein
MITKLDKSDGQTLSNNTWTIITWTRCIRDDAGGFTLAAPSIITTPVGFNLARATARSFWQAISENVNRALAINLNGVTVASTITQALGETPQSAMTKWLPTSPGDQWIVWGRTQHTGTMTFGQPSNNWSAPWFQLEWGRQ